MFKKTLLCLGMAFICILILSAMAEAVMIKNMSDQRLLIPIPGKGTLSLAPGATATITSAELSTQAVQNHIRNGNIVVVTPRFNPSNTVMIRNVSNQRLLIPIPGKGTLSLAPGATATITRTELSTQSVQNLIRNGRIRVVTR